jgi:hypothetical protein
MASYMNGDELGTNIFQLWWMGVQEVPGAAAGTIQKAETVVKSGVKTVASTTRKVLNAIGGTAEGAASVVKSLPLVLGILAVGVAGYLIFSGKKGTDFTQFIPRPRLPK